MGEEQPEPLIMRAARSEIGEGLVFARYLDQAAEGFMSFLLGGGFEQVIAQAFLRPGNEYSFKNVIFAEGGHGVFGMAAGFTAEERQEFSERPLRQAENFPAVRYGLLRALLAPLFRLLSTVEAGDFYLLSLAVDRAARGRGIGSLLLDEIEERASARGAVRLTLDVAAANEGARRLYERRGMVVERAWPGVRIVPPLFMRMTKRL